MKPASTAEQLDYNPKFNTAAVVFCEAVKRMKNAYCSYHPADKSPDKFFETLTSMVLEAHESGVSWTAIGNKLWTPLMLNLQQAF